ncbi:hypothetical protein GJAV_G00186700 [Gymnothorax javanicus]|nr:hypothetical protein GJAV_G00186700 [Gymnothorax javanicus]
MCCRCRLTFTIFNVSRQLRGNVGRLDAHYWRECSAWGSWSCAVGRQLFFQIKGYMSGSARLPGRDAWTLRGQHNLCCHHLLPGAMFRSGPVPAKGPLFWCPPPARPLGLEHTVYPRPEGGAAVQCAWATGPTGCAAHGLTVSVPVLPWLER